MQLVFDLIEPQELIDYIRAYDNEVLREEANFVLDQWLPNREVDDLEFRIRKGALNDVDVAEYRAWDTQPTMTGRPGVSHISGSLGPVSRQIPLGEEEMLRQRSLDRGTDDPIIDAIYDDAERMVRAVQARIEIARGDLLDDGIVTIEENGLTLEADFGRDATMSPTVAVDWSDPSALILTELLGYQETYEDQNGVTPGELVVPRSMVGNFALNQEFLDYASFAGTTPQRINRQTVDSILAAEGLPPIRVYDGQFRVNGVRTRVLNEEKVYFMPPAGEPLGNTFYGVTAEALRLRSRGLISRDAAPGVVAVVLMNDNPVQTFTLGTAIALPAMPNPDLVMDILTNAP